MSDKTTSYLHTMTDLSTLTCLILAGGKGTRLRPLVSDRPKVLAPVKGKPFIFYILDKLAEEGARDVVLCTGYMASMVSAALGMFYRGMTLKYSVESQPLGTGGAVRNALDMTASDPVLVLNGDSLFDAPIAPFVSWYVERQSKAAILLTRVANSGRYGRVERDAESRITAFREKNGRDVAGDINAGVYLLNRSIIETIPPNTFYSLETDLFPGLSGKCLDGFSWETPFIDIGTEESFLKAGDFVRRSL